MIAEVRTKTSSVFAGPDLYLLIPSGLVAGLGLTDLADSQGPPPRHRKQVNHAMTQRRGLMNRTAFLLTALISICCLGAPASMETWLT